MAYSLNWLDGKEGIAFIRLTDPFGHDDLVGLEADFAPAVATGNPLYLIVDIRQFNALGALALLGTSDGLPLPDLSTDQARRSRLAIIGSSALVRLLLKMVDNDDSDQIRPFTDEQEAVAWLSSFA